MLTTIWWKKFWNFERKMCGPGETSWRDRWEARWKRRGAPSCSAVCQRQSRQMSQGSSRSLTCVKRDDQCLKGVGHEIFTYWFFVTNQFPPYGPDYPIEAISNFPENSRIYSKVKASHRTGVNEPGDGWEKYWDRKFSHILFRSYWVAIYTYRIHFSKTFI